MLLKDESWKNCKSCKRRTTIIRQSIFGCDACKKVIDMNQKNRSYLEFTVFNHSDTNVHHHLCSWRCAFKWLPTVKTDYFISLPYLTFDNSEYNSALTQEFFKLTTKIKA